MLHRRIQKLEQASTTELWQGMCVRLVFEQPDGTVRDRDTGESWESAEACMTAVEAEDSMLIICVDASIRPKIVHKPAWLDI